jgi:hypothetical protein
MTPLAQAAAVILARQSAERLVKKRIRAEGRIPLSTLSHATITRLANDLVASCPALVAAAAADKRRKPAAQGLPLRRNQERNGAPR